MGFWVALEAFLFCIGSQIFCGPAKRERLAVLSSAKPGVVQAGGEDSCSGERWSALMSCFKEDLTVQLTLGCDDTICHSECEIESGRICERPLQ